MEGYMRGAIALSVAGAVCLPTFGLILRLQPQFVHGLHTEASTAEVNCYIGGACYAGVLLVCLVTLASQRCRRGAREEGHALDEVDKRNRRYRLPFTELESEGFVKAMKARDAARSAAPVTPGGRTSSNAFPTKGSLL
ncbi:hypothetical protein BBJ28_00002193 [Nothophytophthora sp. Chile5]|nr:hypothetical protein BBJ28_00002193 [Nothophytophthora sp. Chile5]